MSKLTLREHLNKKFNLLSLRMRFGKKCVYVVHAPLTVDDLRGLREQYMAGTDVNTVALRGGGHEHCFRHKSGGSLTIISMEQVRAGRLLELAADVTLFDKAVSRIDFGAHVDRRKAH